MDKLIEEYPYSGLPIGNRYSPMLANLYFSDMDHKLKQKYHAHYFISFMDDRCILGYSKKWLHRILDKVIQMLDELHLQIKPNYQIFPIDKRGIAFLGYRIFRTHILLLKRTKRKLKKTSDILEKQVMISDEPLSISQ